MKRLVSLIALSLIITTPLLSAENKETAPNLEGSWTGKAKEVVELSFAFTKEGQVTFQINGPKFQQTFPNGIVGKYKIIPGKPYSQIDITDFDKAPFNKTNLLGIVESIDQNTMKMEFKPNPVGSPPKRLEKFTKDAVVFKKAKAKTKE